MRIITLSTHQEKCGIATYNDALVAALRAQGHAADIHPIITSVARTKSKAELLSYFDDFLFAARSYDAVIIQHEFGLIGGKYPASTAHRVMSRMLGRLTKAGKPVAIIFHSGPEAPKRLLSRKRYHWYRICRLINSNRRIFGVVHGDPAAQQYLDAGFRRDSIWVTRHPLPATVALPPRPRDETVTLTIFGFVAAYKGYAEAVEALDQLPDNYRLVIAGGPHPTNTIDKTFETISAMNHPRIELTGWLDDSDVPDIMARTDIVLAPYHENGPAGSGAVTWALACGRPVVATSTFTFNDIQAEANCFAMVPPLDSNALAGKIAELAHDAPMRMELASRGLSYAARHSWSAMATELARRFSEA